MWHFEIIMNSDVQALQTLNLITSVGTNDLLQVMLMIDKMQHLKPQRHRQNYIKMWHEPDTNWYIALEGLASIESATVTWTVLRLYITFFYSTDKIMSSHKDIFIFK